jgi:nitric oxide reductase large subunit
VEFVGEVGDRCVGTSELLQHTTAGGVRERCERGVEAGNYILNHPVQYMTDAFRPQAASLIAASRRTRVGGSFLVRTPNGSDKSPPEAKATADFLVYSALMTVAHRPGSNVSWTQNWPYEPKVGNEPATATFIWTWASFCFVFLGFGAVLFIYKVYLSESDGGQMDPTLRGFLNLTPSQRKTGRYFLFVAAVFLLQIGAGSIMAHYYSDRTSFYGIQVGSFLPDNFLRCVHIQAPLVWIAFSWIGAGLFLAPAISGHEARHQGLLVDTDAARGLERNVE